MELKVRQAGHWSRSAARSPSRSAWTKAALCRGLGLLVPSPSSGEVKSVSGASGRSRPPMPSRTMTAGPPRRRSGPAAKAASCTSRGVAAIMLRTRRCRGRRRPGGSSWRSGRGGPGSTLRRISAAHPERPHSRQNTAGRKTWAGGGGADVGRSGSLPGGVERHGRALPVVRRRPGTGGPAGTGQRTAGGHPFVVPAELGACALMPRSTRETERTQWWISMDSRGRPGCSGSRAYDRRAR